MKFKKPKHVGWIIAAIVVVGFIGFSLIPKPMKVEKATVQRQLLRQTIDAEARMRYTDRYVIAMPSTGTIERIDLEPGDSVLAGAIVAFYTPPALDARQRSETLARAEAANAAVSAARQQLTTLQPLLEQNQRRDERSQRLLASGAIPKEQAENAHDAFLQTQSELEAVKSRIKAASYEERAIRAAISAAPGQRVSITAPVTGVILRRYEENERTLMAGTPIMEIGDRTKQEIVIDVLSTDAVKVRTGQVVLITGWGGEDTLIARVTRVEPAARVKVSSLGVEEKRVDVVAVLAEASSVIGDAYKVDAGIVLWEKQNVVTVPLGALLREKNGWYTFVVEDGKAKKRSVTLGPRSALLTSVSQGLTEGETVILHPAEALKENDAVE
ncbi:MAG: efflux RND transporter periplasmic adaptor subunit [Ignavibacteria bacterium]|nr:efflux RND transporter periplasmic adaptor subunit [Ignavibacteria bacterium]